MHRKTRSLPAGLALLLVPGPYVGKASVAFAESFKSIAQEFLEIFQKMYRGGGGHCPLLVRLGLKGQADWPRAGRYGLLEGMCMGTVSGGHLRGAWRGRDPNDNFATFSLSQFRGILGGWRTATIDRTTFHGRQGCRKTAVFAIFSWPYHRLDGKAPKA